MKDQIYERIFSSTTSSIKEDGKWKLRVEMVEKARLSSESPWEEKHIVATAEDEIFSVAYNTAMEELLNEFNSILSQNNGAGLLDKSFYSQDELGPVDKPSRVVSATE